MPWIQVLYNCTLHQRFKYIVLPMYIQQSLVPWPYVHSLHIETQGTQTCPGPISQKTG